MQIPLKSEDSIIESDSHLCLLPLLVGRTEALHASSFTGKDLTRRTRGTATRGRLTGSTRGTGDTLPRNSNNLKREDGKKIERWRRENEGKIVREEQRRKGASERRERN